VFRLGQPASKVASSRAMVRKKMTRLCAKTKLCMLHTRGMCRKGEACSFAHHQEELRPLPDFARTKLCPLVRANGACADPVCRYAHDESELRADPRHGLEEATWAAHAGPPGGAAAPLRGLEPLWICGLDFGACPPPPLPDAQPLAGIGPPPGLLPWLDEWAMCSELGFQRGVLEELRPLPDFANTSAYGEPTCGSELFGPRQACEAPTGRGEPELPCGRAAPSPPASALPMVFDLRPGVRSATPLP